MASRGGIKKAKKEKGPSPNAPKGPRSAYFFWLKENRSRIAKPGMSVTDISKAASAEWNTISVNDKRKYEKMATQDKVKTKTSSTVSRVSKNNKNLKTPKTTHYMVCKKPSAKSCNGKSGHGNNNGFFKPAAIAVEAVETIGTNQDDYDVNMLTPTTKAQILRSSGFVPIIASESGEPLAISSHQHRRKRRSSVSPYRKIREQTPLSHPSPSNTGSPIASLSSFTSQGRKSFSLLEFD